LEAKELENISIQAEQEILRGRYANNLRASITQEEFILDYLLISPLGGEILVSRVTVSPAHLKRISQYLSAAMAEYEQKFSTQVKPAGTPNPIGFKTDLDEVKPDGDNQGA
jgi:hypothetical protein